MRRRRAAGVLVVQRVGEKSSDEAESGERVALLLGRSQSGQDKIKKLLAGG